MEESSLALQCCVELGPGDLGPGPNGSDFSLTKDKVKTHQTLRRDSLYSFLRKKESFLGLSL